MLVCVFGVQYFHVYIFGYAFTTESHHKPLDQMKLNNLVDVPVHIQRMLHCEQNYDFVINYCPGKEMLVVDILSHYALPNALEVPFNIAMNQVDHSTEEDKSSR